MYTKISNQLLVLSLNTMFWTQRNCALNDQTACGLPNSPGASHHHPALQIHCATHTRSFKDDFLLPQVLFSLSGWRRWCPILLTST